MIPNFYLFGKELSAYMLLALAGFLIILFFTRSLAQKRGLDDIHMLCLLLFSFIGVFVGSHLLYALTQWEYILYVLQNLNRIDSFSLLIGTLIQIFGGAVFYGGLLGGLLVGFLYIRHTGIPAGPYADICAPAAALFHTFGRLGCFTSGCCYGVECAWGVTYRYAAVPEANGVPRFPVQLVEAGLNLALFFFLYRCLRKEKLRGRLLAVYLTVYPIYRFLLEFFRGDDIRGFLGPLSTSQVISLLILAAVAVYTAVTAVRLRKKHK